MKLDQVDDVLASLVVFDDAGGVGGLELPGRDETEAAFADVPFGPDALASPLALLNSLQGVEISVAGPRPMTGRIVQAESVTEPVAATPGSAPQAVARTRVTLIGPDGMHQFVLEDAEQVQVTDPDLRGRIGHALEAVRRDARADRRHLSIRAPGTGHRTVRVGFVAVAPLWKASYRLVLPNRAASTAPLTARMQGWAVLENATGADWNGVQIALQYGNPVTFHQALYRTYFVERPEVPVEILGRLLPDVDTGARAKLAGGDTASAPAFAFASQAQTRALSRPMLAGAPPPAPAPAIQMAAPADIAGIAESAEETVFSLAMPLSLPAGHTASVPILDQALPAARIGLLPFGRAHPLASVKVTNATADSLPAGVLTLYDQSAAAAFAGDARLGGLPAGDSRLLSFAEDLRSSAEWRTGDATTLAAVTASGGVLRLDQRDRRTTTLTLTAPAKESRTLFVEIAKTPGYALVRDDPAISVEETATAWRLGVTLAAGEVRRLTVHTDRLRRQQVALIDDDAALVRLIGDQSLAAPARAALQQLADLRRVQAQAETARDRLKADLEVADNDEERVRSNLAAVPAGDALHTRLIRQLDADETKIAALNQSIAQAEQAVERARQIFRDAVGRFTL